MSSVFDTEKPIHLIYDLKGSTVGRVTSDNDCKNGAVQKDLNLQQSGSKFMLGSNISKHLAKTLKSDARFLARLNIMDYSLLVGVHNMRSIKTGKRFSSVHIPKVLLSSSSLSLSLSSSSLSSSSSLP
jgi:hypothetical protein